jgi:cation diffusion facilitator family transporter
MHSRSLAQWQHSHAFLGEAHERNERRTWLVVGLTAAMMAAEIVGGNILGSMAVVADGWHMSTHASALAIAALAYGFARKRAADPRFSFGTGKLGELAGFASAIILGLVAVLVAYQSAVRFFSPVAIDFAEAIVLAAVGLCVNLLSAVLLKQPSHHGDDGAHAHHHHHHHADHNLRAAYIHVLADALTSVLAVVGLLAAWRFGYAWADPLVGLVGAVVILVWAFGLVRSSAAVLLDTVPDKALVERVRARLEVGTDKVADLHIWRLGPGHSAVIASVVADRPEPPESYKARLAPISGLSHVTIEVHRCPDHQPARAAA